MPRGQPDYGVYTQTSLGAGISDPGEAAARLDAINIYDRRGWTYWQDDFEAPVIRWDTAGLTGGVAPVLDTTRSVSGIQCVKLACGLNALSDSRILRHFSLIRLGKIGAEFWVQAKKVALAEVQAYISIYDGTNNSRATLRYYPNTGRIDITTPLGDINVATLVHMTQTGKYFLPIKVVVDMDSDYWGRLLVGEREIDISAHQLVNVGATTDRAIILLIRLFGVAAVETEAYVDNVIFTVAEP